MIEIKKSVNIDEIYKIEASCFLDAWTYEMISAELKKDNAHFFVATKDGKSVGYMLINTCLDEAEILKICVLAEERRCGLGKKIIDYAFNYLKDISVVNLEVRKSNEPAIKLYEKCGFKKTGIRQKYYKDNEDAVLMTKLF